MRDEFEPISVKGWVAPVLHGGWRGLVRLLTGMALVMWALRGLARMLGLRWALEVTLDASVINVVRRTTLLGHTIRSSQATYAKQLILGIKHEDVKPLSRLTLGLILGISGLVVGASLSIDGLRLQNWTILTLGLGVIVLGALCDFVFDVFWQSARSTYVVQIWLKPDGHIALHCNDHKSGESLTNAVQAMLARPAANFPGLVESMHVN